MIERIVEIVEHPYLVDGEKVYSYGDQREEVVRCGECKHMHTVRHWLGMDVIECWLHADSESGALGKNGTQPDGFCAWGKRREDADADGA